MTARGYHHGDLRRGLVEAGLAILEEEGLAALSLRGAAARAGVSHAAPRNHFRGLSGLVSAIVAEGFRRHAAAMRAEMAAAPDDPESQAVAAGEGYCAFAVAHPALFKLMFASERSDPADEDLHAAKAASYEVLAEVARGLDLGRPAGPHGDTEAELHLWSLAHGFASLLADGQVGAPEGAVAWRPRFRDVAARLTFRR